METRVAIIGIIIEDKNSVEQINSVLHDNNEYIIGRMGIPYRERNISVMSIVIDAPQDVINTMSGRIGKIPGVSAKTAYSNVITKAVNNE
jgi:putative iron-only hydrogenase system regulator